MPESSAVHGPAPGGSIDPPRESDSFALHRSRLLLAVLLAVGTTVWQHWVLFGADGPFRSHLRFVLVDLLLMLPAAGFAVRWADGLGRRVRPGGTTGWDAVVQASVTVVVLTVLDVPLAVVQAGARTVLGAEGAHHHGASALSAGDPAGLLAYGIDQAVQVGVAVMVLTMVGTLLVEASPTRLWRAASARLRHPGRAGRRLRLAVIGAVAGALMAPTGVLAQPAEDPLLAGARTCATAPQRVFNVSAIDVDIVVDRFGDHDPYGYMYVLAEKEGEVRAQEAALRAASAMKKDDPAAAKVSIGLAQDAIQPLVIRARLGECVVVNLTNKLVNAPRSGFGLPVVTQPGGVPPVSVDVAGVAYDAAAGDGGQPVGNNPSTALAAPGETRQYRYYLDPLGGEGAKVMRSGGESTQLTAHGLFGTLIAERPGSHWFDPVTGADRTDDTTWSNWEAMVSTPGNPAFREFTLMYHEMGDENFTMRRPLRENDEGIPIGNDPGKPIGDQVQYGRTVPMIDGRPPTPSIPNEGGGGTNVYRPASRAINYRSEPFFRRLQLEAVRGAATQQANKSLAYSSYTYGDPATPMPRSYLGEPTKTRIVDAGIEQLHVHHVHGGGTRWRLDPGIEDSPMEAGLSKTPLANQKSVSLDSQTISPTETFTLDHDCGAGGCQQAVGDFLYHCHIAQHYITGMWGLWRVYDTAQPDLAPLPGQQAAPTAVTSAGLVGRTIGGKHVVPAAQLADPDHEIAVEQLVEANLPPQGTRWATDQGQDPDDATVWDWQKAGTLTEPVYLGEPETASVWANYRSGSPGQRPEILFNPTTGRPAYPMLRPHLGQRPPFSPNGHSGAPGVGETGTDQNPGGMCPNGAPVRTVNVTAITTPIQQTSRETDPNGELFVLNEDKAGVLDRTKPADPLVIRSNVGDCSAITLGSELNPAQQPKVNMHTHLVQFDPLASDGVIAGFAYEQSIFSTAREGRTLNSVDAPDKVTVSSVDKLRPGITIGVGVGRADIEIRKITAINGNQLTFDTGLTAAHDVGEPVTVEFVQYRWFADIDVGTVFWHDHVNGISSWAHGLFAAHIIEPEGSKYQDPATGAELRSGPIADIVDTRGGSSVGVGQHGSFREFTLFLHNGRRGRGELSTPPPGGLTPFNSGQECEEGSINLRAAPLGERTPPGSAPADPTTTDQRQEYNGSECRNAFSRAPDTPGKADANTVRGTVSTVDPYVFSSVKYGDPGTPLLRAYAGDPVVIRTIGVTDRAEALRIQGHRFRMERFNSGGQLMDTATTGISERFDYVLDGGAGGPSASPGDYLYYSTRTFAVESGAWGIFRVHDTLQPDLRPLPDRARPAEKPGFPVQSAATGNTQAAPGPNPAPAYRADGTVDTSVVTSTANPCPRRAPTRAYDVSVFNQALPTAPFKDDNGVVYALSSDVAAVQAGTKPLEPLVLRVNKGDCVSITLNNRTTPGSLYGGTRAGLDLGKLMRNQQLSSGAAVGLNPDTTIGTGQSITYTFYADQELGASLFQNLGSPASLRHGGYGMLIVEPKGSTWSDSETGAPLGATATSTKAIIRGPGNQRFREFALTMQSTDQQFSRSILPYGDQVAGNGLNSPIKFNWPQQPIPGAPPGTGTNPGSFDKGYNNLNYHSAPLTTRLGLTANPDDYTKATPTGPFALAFSSVQHGDPDTPVFRANSSDPVVFRVGVGASDQLHSFTVGGHSFPLEPGIDHSRMMAARTITAGETIDAKLGRAGGRSGYTGDFLFADARMPFAQAGMWGILRVLPDGSPDSPAVL